VTDFLRRRLRRVARAVALAVHDPGDAWLAARMLAWRAILPVLKYLLPLRRLVGLMNTRATGRARRPEREQRITSLAERVFDHRRSGQQCLELSLVTYRYLGAAGADPRLVIAIRNDGQLARGHAWVTVDGAPVHDSPSLLDDFASVVTFESGGRAHPSEVARDAEG
jgi:hypothetical protein